MPIKGLSERTRLPRLGKIRLGLKEVSARTGNPYPRAVDYFVCPPEVQTLYSAKPRELPICFPVEDETQFAPQWYKRYSQTRGRTCKGDGEFCERLVDKATGDFAHADSKDVELRETLPCSGEDCPEYQAKRCRRVMNLLFLLPEVPGLGVYQVDTSSVNSIININSGVALVRGTLGRVAMIPLILALVPQEVTPAGERKKTVYVLQLRVEVSLIEAQRLAALPSGRMLLPPPEVAEEEAEVGNGQALPTEGQVVVVAPDEGVPEDLFPSDITFKEEPPDITFEKESVVDTSPLGEFPTFGDVAVWAKKDFHIMPSQILADFGIGRWESFKSPQKAVEAIKAKYGRKGA